MADETDARAAGAAGERDFQAEADRVIADLTEGLPNAEAALALTVLVNRVGTRLHNLARAESAERKGTAEWPMWAALQNVSRDLVLRASTARDQAAKLAGRRR